MSVLDRLTGVRFLVLYIFIVVVVSFILTAISPGPPF